MKNPVKVWFGAMVLFWLSFLATFLIDYLGLVETENLGFVETLWISWIWLTVGFGAILAILTRFAVKD